MRNRRPTSLRPRHGRFISFALLCSALSALGGAPRADATTVADVAQYRGADRQAVLEAGARKEGALTLYTVGTQIEPLIKRFRQIYPYIDVKLLRGDSVSIASRAAQEYQAGYHVMDGLELSSYGLVPLRDEKVLAPFWSPQEANYEKDAIEPHGDWVVVRESFTGLGFNTKLVAPSAAPKTYADLLQPQWKGKLAISGTIATAANWVGALVLSEGKDFVRKLGSQNLHVYNMTGRALANLMIAGEVAISPTIYNSHVRASAAKGAPLAWRALGPVPVTDTAVAIAADAPHPHAMMLLIDFLMSKEGQRLYRSIGYDSARLDMHEAGEPKLKKLYLAARPHYEQDFASWARLYKQTFVR